MTRRKVIIIILLLLVISLTFWIKQKWWRPTGMLTDLSRLKRDSSAIAELAEVILPRTDTPGAKDVHVELFIIDMVTYCLSDAEQYTFVKGLMEAARYSMDRFERSIVACSDKQRLAVVQWLEERDSLLFDVALLEKIRRRLFGRSFFQLLKTLTVEGYCTAELGATRGLAYDAIPGSYTPCMTFNGRQKAWATT